MLKETRRQELITRREAILRVGAMLGGAALVGQSAMLTACAARPVDEERATYSNSLFSQADVGLLDDIADTILPETNTPGARAAGVGPFMAMMVADTYYERDQRIFRAGLSRLQSQCLDLYGARFPYVTQAQRLTLLEILDAEQHQYMQDRQDDAPVHYFRMLKELTLVGYFTSEIGYTQAMRYVESPGRFEPCAPYPPGQKAWADHA